MVLFVSFQWRANSWLVLANLPFSLIGSVLGDRGDRNRHLLGHAWWAWSPCSASARAMPSCSSRTTSTWWRSKAPRGICELVLRGANERFVPILMTAAVTALGLAPLAFGMNQPGQEIEGPMAVTVLGGLLSSTLLNLFVLPALAQRYVRISTSAPQ